MSEWYPIVRFEKGNGRLRHWLRQGGEEQCRDFFDVRAALTWNPLFYCILGEEHYGELYFDQGAVGILRLLDEYQEPSLSITAFLDRLTDSMTLLGASICYGQTGEAFKAHVDSYWQYMDKRRLRLDLLEAPHSNDFGLLMSKVQDAVSGGVLRVERSSNTSQDLQSFTLADLEDGEKFFRLKALAFAVASFEKYASRRQQFKPGVDFYRGPLSWMGA